MMNKFLFNNTHFTSAQLYDYARELQGEKDRRPLPSDMEPLTTEQKNEINILLGKWLEEASGW